MRKNESQAENAQLSHLSKTDQARMVDVSDKNVTARSATAEAVVHVGPEVAELIRRKGGVAKGNVLETARIAGIMAAKKTPELIPMCHTLALDAVDIQAELASDAVRIVAVARCRGATGVEMEAMTAASVAALTIYDMVKSAARSASIGPVRLLEKTGGKSGRWTRQQQQT